MLLGVNTDGSREKLRQAEEKERLNFRSWWDGPEGPIVPSWGVNALPAVYLIDHRGLIRYESQGAPEPKVLGKKIDQLLREANAG